MKLLLLFISISFFSFLSAATSSVGGIVHDPQHRPIPGAQIILHGPNDSATKTAQSDANGEFRINDVPEGAYTVEISAAGFQSLQQPLAVTADKAPVLHFQLELAPLNSSVEVSGAASRLNTHGVDGADHGFA